jgi:hypothetical protein
LNPFHFGSLLAGLFRKDPSALLPVTPSAVVARAAFLIKVLRDEVESDFIVFIIRRINVRNYRYG